MTTLSRFIALRERARYEAELIAWGIRPADDQTRRRAVGFLARIGR